MKKIWLKAAKTINGTWILLILCVKRENNPPAYPTKFLCRSCRFQFTSFWINLRYPAKRKTDVLEITAFLPVSDSLFGLRLTFKQSYFTWSDCSLIFNEMGTEKPRIRKNPNTLCKQLMIGRRRCTIPLSYIALLWTIQQFQDRSPLFWYSNMKVGGYHVKWIVDWTSNAKQLSLRVYVYISRQLTAPSNRRILSDFQILLNRSESFPQRILWRSKRTTYCLPKARFSANYFV